MAGVMIRMAALAAAALCFFRPPLAAGTLHPDFYKQICPEAAHIVKDQVDAAIRKERRTSGSLLRLHFRDCFDNGCDASVLLDDTSTSKGFNVINDIKQAMENQCPGAVSCADILALAALFAVANGGGPKWDLPLGRRDSRTASFAAANNVTTGVPPPTFTLAQLRNNFAAHGLDHTDLVALSGAHTVGVARCVNFKSRIYSNTDIDQSFAVDAQRNCSNTTTGSDNNTRFLDVTTPTTFDNGYFHNLINNKGLLFSDQQLMAHKSTARLVLGYKRNKGRFFKDFGKSMIKMASIGVIEGGDPKGEVRKNCRFVNS